MNTQQRELTLDRYVRIEQPKPPEDIQIQDHEIRITGPGKTRNYIAYATGLLTQKGCTAVELKAMGQAINKTVTIAEIIKRRILGLHQNNQLASIAIQDTWEPIEEGLDSISVTRHVSVISITLSTVPLDERSPGYQPPLPPEMVKTHLSPMPHLGPGFGDGGSMGGGMGSSKPSGSTLGGGSLNGSTVGSGSSLMDGYSGPLAMLQAAQQQLQAQGMQPGMHEGLGRLGMQQQQQQEMLGPVVHFDGRDHRRNQSRNRPGHRSGGGGGGGGPAVGGHNYMLDGIMN
jgi:DNA-binding protein